MFTSKRRTCTNYQMHTCSWLHVSKFTGFEFKNVHADTYRTLHIILFTCSHSQVLYCTNVYRHCVRNNICGTVAMFLYMCLCWHVSYCTPFRCTNLQVDTYRSAWISIVHVSSLALYKNSLYTFPSWFCTNVFLRVSWGTRVVLYKILLYTCPCWWVWHCTNLCWNCVLVDTYRGIQIYCTGVHVEKYGAVQTFHAHVLVWYHELDFTVHQGLILSIFSKQKYFLHMHLEAVCSTYWIRNVHYTQAHVLKHLRIIVRST